MDFIRNFIRNLLKTEASVFIGVITALLGLAISYGLVSQARADAWIAFLGLMLPVLLPLIQGWITRQNVFSTETVQKIANAATNLPAGTPVDIGNPPNPDASPPLPSPGDQG